MIFVSFLSRYSTGPLSGHLLCSWLMAYGIAPEFLFGKTELAKVAAPVAMEQ